MRKLATIGLCLLTLPCFSLTREIAVTLDDLPLVASQMNSPGNQQRSNDRFMKIIQAFKDNNVPVTGFVIGGAIEKGQWAFLEAFHGAGLQMGNHTYSHKNLNKMGAEQYIADIDRADKVLAPLLTSPKYFRYPYLAEGNKVTKPAVLSYLAAHDYIVAPVTIDSKDYDFNQQLYRIPYRARESAMNGVKKRYLAYIWSATLKAEKRANGRPVKQILLIHSNLLNSYLLGDVIQMYKQNGYRFITLTEALENPAPAINFPASSAMSEKPLNDDLDYF